MELQSRTQRLLHIQHLMVLLYLNYFYANTKFHANTLHSITS